MSRTCRRGPVAVLLAAGLVAASCGPREEETVAPAEQGAPPVAVEVSGDADEGEDVTLLFPAEDGLLHPEVRRLVLPGGLAERATAILGVLLAGPQSEGLIAPLPEEVTLAGVLVDGDGIAYVDLRSAEAADPPASGSRLELQRVYSLVNTLLVNVEQVESVVLLWNGSQRPTLAGHVDTGHPLVVNHRLYAVEP